MYKEKYEVHKKVDGSESTCIEVKKIMKSNMRANECLKRGIGAIKKTWV